MTYDPRDDAAKSYDAAIEAIKARHDAIMGAGAKEIRYIGDAVMILGDCLQCMPAIGTVDAVVTDPPYGVGRDKGFGVGGKGIGGGRNAIGIGRYVGDWDRQRPSVEVFACFMRAAPAHIIWGGQFFADILPPKGKWLWWDKCQTMPSYGDGELAWTSLPGDAPKKFVYSNNGLLAKEKNRVHPTQKPVALMKWCLGFLPDARTILDPFMGSGTTGVAALELDRRFIGIELDPAYYDIACKRVEEAWRQPRLIETEKAKPEEPASLFDARDFEGDA